MKISVITPSYNSGAEIERAILSVLSQDYADYEHIVVDGASKDNTLEVLKKYDHLKWVSEPDNGQAEAMNKGFSMSTGEVIVYLNADDYFFEEAFSKVIPHFKTREKMVVGKVLVMTQKADKVQEWTNDPKADFKSMLKHWEPNAFCVNPVGYFYCRELQEEIGGYNEDNDLRHDLEFLLELSLRCKVKKIDEYLGVFNHGKDTKTSRAQLKPSSWSIDSRLFIDRLARQHLSSEELPMFQLERERGYQLRRLWTILDCFERGMAKELLDEGEVFFLPQDHNQCSMVDAVVDHSYPAAKGDWIIPVLTVGKVAGGSIFTSLKTLPREVLPSRVFHLHLLNRNSWNHFLPPCDGIDRSAVLVGKALGELFNSSYGRQLCWKFIAGVREPIGGSISEYFENYPNGKLVDLLDRLNHTFQWRLDYFDTQYFRPLGIDVFECEFDHKSGYTIIKNDKLEVLLYRFEDLPRIFSTAMEDYLGIPDMKLPRVNIASEKTYAEAHKQAKETLRFDRGYLDKIYSSKLMRHFYTDEEIDDFCRQWQKPTLFKSSGNTVTMIDLEKLPDNIYTSIIKFCKNINISKELIDFWDNSDNGIFVSKSERFFKNLNFKKGDPINFYKNPPPNANPLKVNDSRKLVSVLFEHLSCYMGDDPTILDIGGYIGRFSVESAKLLQYYNSNDIIYLFEPGLTIPLIRANLHINSVANLVEVNNVAVSNKKGSEIYQLEKDNMISGNLCDIGKAEITYEIQTIKLVDFLESRAIKGPLITKIDTEGLEAKVIDGLMDYNDFFNSVYIVEFWKGYLEYSMRGEKFIDFLHNNFIIYNIKSSLYPRRGSKVKDLKVFADSLDPQKGNVDILLIPKNIIELDKLLESLAIRGLI